MTLMICILVSPQDYVVKDFVLQKATFLFFKKCTREYNFILNTPAVSLNLSEHTYLPLIVIGDINNSY